MIINGIAEATRKQRREVRRWQAGLDELHSRIAHRFLRSEVRKRARRYLMSLLGRVERKNGWQLAEEIGESGPQGVQRLLNAATWDADAVRDDLRDYVVEHLGTADGVLIVDETGFLKKGTKSVGVQRQYSGAAGRIDNCQIGVFLSYASSKGKALIDRELYLPKEWSGDPARREEAGVPDDVEFTTKPELARKMLERAFEAGVPAAWVTGDKVYGDNSGLRRYLEKREQAYVMGVTSSHSVWHEGRSQRADHVIEDLPAGSWTTLSSGEGSQGPRLNDWNWMRLPYESPFGMAYWLLARRNNSDPTDIAYFRAFSRAETSLAELVWVAGIRWTIEECFQQAKGILGMDQYEVRKWNAWYRHVTLSLLAHVCLEITRRRSMTASGAELEKGEPQEC